MENLEQHKSGLLFLKVLGLSLFLIFSFFPRTEAPLFEKWVHPLKGKESAQSIVWHRFFDFRGRTIHVPGFEISHVDSAIQEHFFFPKLLAELGYTLRASLHQIPPWILDRGGQLYLREEIADEFYTPVLEETRVKSETDYVALVHEFEARYRLKVAVLVIPTKIFANGVSFGFSQMSLQQRERFSITPQSPMTGSEIAEREAEKRLRDQGIQVISILDPLKSLRDSHPKIPLYPPSDSHWSRRTLLGLAPMLAKQIVTVFQLSPGCYNSENPTSKLPVRNEPFLGDLYGYLQMGWILSDRYSSTEIEVPKLESLLPPRNPACPSVWLMGTSYGEKYMGDGDVSQFMQLFYRGAVVNDSINGGGVYGSIRQYAPKLPAGSKVIWEFPFRALKGD